MSEGTEITSENIFKALNQMYSAIPTTRKRMEVYWPCDTANDWIESMQYCKSKECVNCSKYRKALKNAKGYGRR